MSHLSLETIARLVDDAPTALEAAHLAACAQCRDELQQMHGQVAELGSLPAIEPPRDDWDRLERRLAAEGLIRTQAPRRQWLHYSVRAAAAVALFALGTASGRYLLATSSPADSPVATTSPAQQEPMAEPGGYPAETSPSLVGNAQLVNDLQPAAPRTPEEALRQLRAAESSYLDALTRFAEMSGNTDAGDPAARLAALEGIVLTTRAALSKAPTDPVINGYHLTALAQREATLRQVAATNNTELW